MEWGSGRAVVVKRLVCALLAGSAITSLAWLADTTNNDTLTAVIGLVWLPGVVVGMFAGMAAGGGIHDANWPVTVCATALFWGWITYLLLRWRSRRSVILNILRAK